MQHYSNKGGYLYCDACWGLHLSLYQPINREQISQLVLGVWVIGWFSYIVFFGPVSFGFR